MDGMTIGGGGLAGVAVVIGREVLPKIFPSFHRVSRKEAKELIENHHLCCQPLIDEKLKNGNDRFTSLEKRAEEDRALADSRHKEIVGYLMEIASKR